MTTRSTTALILTSALALTLAACAPDAQDRETAPDRSTEATTPDAESTPDAASQPTEEPTEAPTSDAEETSPGAIDFTLPALSTIDGEPVDVREPLDTMSFRVGVEGEDYEIEAIFSEAVPDDGTVENLWFAGASCAKDAIVSMTTDTGIAVGPVVVGSDASAGGLPPVAGRDVAVPEDTHGGVDYALEQREDGAVVWIRTDWDTDPTTWTVFAAGAEETAARVLATVGDGSIPETEAPSSVHVDGDNVIIVTYDLQDDTARTGVYSVPFDGGHVTAIAGEDAFMAQPVRGGVGYLSSEAGDLAAGMFVAEDWTVHGLAANGAGYDDIAIGLGRGPAEDTFAYFDAAMTDGSTQLLALAGGEWGAMTGWIVVTGETVTAVRTPGFLAGVQITDSFVAAPSEGLGTIILPRDGSEPWILRLGAEGVLGDAYLAGRSCGDTLAFQSTEETSGDPVAAVVTLLP